MWEIEGQVNKIVYSHLSTGWLVPEIPVVCPCSLLNFTFSYVLLRVSLLWACACMGICSTGTGVRVGV